MAGTGIFVQVRDAGELQSAVQLAGGVRKVARAAGCSPAFLCELGTGRRMNVRAETASQIEQTIGSPRGAHFELAPGDVELLAPFLNATFPMKVAV